MSHHHTFSTLPRIFCPAHLKIGSNLLLEQKTFHRLTQVLRLKIGDYLVMFNGEGGEYIAKLASFEKKTALIYIEKAQVGILESPLKIHLGQSIARGEKMDLIVQKATELGVSEITPLFSEFCNVRLDNERAVKRVAHWQEVALHAAEQCGRCVVPKINPAQELKGWMEQIVAEVKMVLSPNATQSLHGLMSDDVRGFSCDGVAFSMLVGPEGGISEKELSFATQYNFSPIKLGPRILRTETAALVALSILQATVGDL